MQRTAFVAGATGVVGSHCVRILASEPAYDRVIALVRRPAGLPDERIVDFEHLDTEDFDTGSDVYCALGTTIRKARTKEAFRRVDHEYPLALARRASGQGARRLLVVSAVAANASSSNLYLRTKGEMERDISALPFESVHIFRPSVLVGRRDENRPAERLAIMAATIAARALVGPLRKYRAIPATQVAGAMVRVALYGSRGVHIYHYDDMVLPVER